MKLTIEPGFEKLEVLAKDYPCLPVYASVYADTETPISLFRRFEQSQENCFLLESVEGGERWARYSFLSGNPLALVTSKDAVTKVCYRDGKTETHNGNPVEFIKDLMTRFKGPVLSDLPRLYGGAVGFFSYDVIRYYERLPNPPPDDLELPDLSFILADEMVAFDHVSQKIILIATIPSSTDRGMLKAAYEAGVKRLENLYTFLHAPFAPASGGNGGFSPGEVVSNVGKEAYMEQVRKAKKHIFDGDIFQIVLSQRFTTKAPPSPFDVYRLLRVTNPSPYMFYIKMNGITLAGASPELLLRCENGGLQTCPIAGSRPRGKTREEDEALEKELLSDEKELSEHVMLVDLGRNDIGRVSDFGSVEVTKYMEIVRYSKIMHISSTVEGKLRDGLSAFDAMMSVFPAGTLSGAPKVRAMELIDAMEPSRRGAYGGAIGYLSFDGNFDSCITIRTILFKDGFAHVQAGAGLVADSDPEKEYEECVNKAGASLAAIRNSGTFF